MLNKPLISIIIPVFNMQKYLSSCLESIISQSFDRFEAIVVEDGSTDKSLEIIRKYAKYDKRIKVLHHSENRGTLIARKTGILQARGEYITFLDPDDYYASSNALQSIYNEVLDTTVDILQFSIKMVFADNPKQEYLKNWLKVQPSFINGTSKLLGTFFRNGDSNAYLWNKIFRANVCKLACSEIPNCYLICATDTTIFFHICYYSQSFKAVDTRPIIVYRVGSGISTSDRELAKFSYQITGRYIAWTIIKNFLQTHGTLKKYHDVYYSAYSSLQTSFLHWFDKLSFADSQVAFALLTRYIKPSTIVNFFRMKYQNRTATLRRKIEYGLPAQVDLSSRRRIAVFCVDFNLCQIAMVIHDVRKRRKFDNMDFLLFINRDIDKLSEVYDDIKFIYVSSNEEERTSQISMSIHDFHLEGVVYCSLYSASTFYDLLLIRLEELPVFIHLGYIYSYQRERGIMTCPDSLCLAQRIYYSNQADGDLLLEQKDSCCKAWVDHIRLQQEDEDIVIVNAIESRADLAQFVTAIALSNIPIQIVILSPSEEIWLTTLQGIQTQSRSLPMLRDVILDTNLALLHTFLPRTRVIINKSSAMCNYFQNITDILELQLKNTNRTDVETITKEISQHLKRIQKHNRLPKTN